MIESKTEAKAEIPLPVPGRGQSVDVTWVSGKKMRMHLHSNQYGSHGHAFFYMTPEQLRSFAGSLNQVADQADELQAEFNKNGYIQHRPYKAPLWVIITVIISLSASVGALTYMIMGGLL